MVRHFLGERKGSTRDMIHRAIIAYPQSTFTTKQLYDFIAGDFHIKTGNDDPNLKGYRPRIANIPRGTNSLGAILSQAAREGVLTKSLNQHKAKWTKAESMPCPDCGGRFDDEHECGDL